MINLINTFNRQLKQDRINEIRSADKTSIIEIVLGSIVITGTIASLLFLVIIL